jgi:hypothetical protein
LLSGGFPPDNKKPASQAGLLTSPFAGDFRKSSFQENDMSRLENTTVPKTAQVAVTQAMLYRPCVGADDSNLQVRAGIDVVDALEDSSSRLSEVLLFICQYTDEEEGLKTSGVYLLKEQVMNAKAVLDASVAGLMTTRRAGGAR